MRVWLVVLCVAALSGCAADGRRLETWSLDADDGPRGTPVTLPNNFSGQLGLREVDYTLTTTVELQPAQRGQTLSLVIDCFHGNKLLVTANGVVLEDRGDGAGGSWRFRIERSLTDGGVLTLRLAVHRDIFTTIGFGAMPRLIDGPDGDMRSRAILAFNRYASLVALCFVSLMSVLYATLYLLDRRRPEYAAILVNSIAVIAVPLLQLGVIVGMGTFGLRLYYLLVVGQFVSLIYFVHHTFRLGPVHRGWLVAIAISWVADTVGATSFQAGVLSSLVKLPVVIAVNGYVIVSLIKLARRGQRRLDAALMLVGWGVNGVWIGLMIVWVTTGHDPLGGLHPLSAGIALTSALQALILGRQHAERQREIATASTELQRQVAERSRELGDALAKLANQSSQPLEPGRTIDDRYRVIRKLGSGGMGTVHEVERIHDGARLALKTLRGRREPDLMARFAREAQIAAEIDHPNVVPVVDIGVTDGSLFLVMPLVAGGSLAEQRAKFGDVTWATLVLAQIAAGLAALHARNIVHRDLKPANVLLATGVARIADFGLASLREAVRETDTVDGHAAAVDLALDDTKTGHLGRASPALTRAGDIFGTPPYMAPELADGVHAVKPSSDMFAFGLIAHELLTGRPAFATPPLLAKLAGQAIQPPDCTPVAAPWRDLIERCLALDPALRPTASEVVAALG